MQGVDGSSPFIHTKLRLWCKSAGVVFHYTDKKGSTDMKTFFPGKTIRGWIFDFNGTLLFDSPAHADAWKNFLLSKGICVTDEEMRRDVQGRPNPFILRHFFGELSEEEIRRYSAEKEEAYREACLSSGKDGWFRLADGAEEMFDRLKAEKIPFTIATSSQWDNVSFYFEHLGLGRWFTPESIVFDNGKMPGKPAPDIYWKAMKLLNLCPEECVVFEDSLSGIAAARAAGAGLIVGVASDLDEKTLQEGGAEKMIRDFRWASDVLHG